LEHLRVKKVENSLEKWAKAKVNSLAAAFQTLVAVHAPMENFMQERKSETTAFEVTIGSSPVHVKTGIVGKPLTGTTRKITDQANLVKGDQALVSLVKETAKGQKGLVMESKTLSTALARTEDLTQSKISVTTVANVRIL